MALETFYKYEGTDRGNKSFWGKKSGDIASALKGKLREFDTLGLDVSEIIPIPDTRIPKSMFHGGLIELFFITNPKLEPQNPTDWDVDVLRDTTFQGTDRVLVRDILESYLENLDQRNRLMRHIVAIPHSYSDDYSWGGLRNMLICHQSKPIQPTKI